MNNSKLFDDMMAALTRGNHKPAKQNHQQEVAKLKTHHDLATQDDIDLLIRKHAERTKKAQA